MKSKFLVLSALVVFSTLLSLRGEGGGEVGRTSRYVGRLNPNGSPTALCEFSVEIERVTFEINSFKNKYKVIRIRVENRMDSSIELSRDEDGVELELTTGETIRGVLNLQKHDGPLWDQLDEGLRKSLAYPLSIHGAKGDETRPRRSEITYLFAFFPADKIAGLPVLFRYTIRSAGQTVKLELPPPTKA